MSERTAKLARRPTRAPPEITEGMNPLDYAILGACPPCSRCIKMAFEGQIRTEMVQPLPPEPLTPLAVDGSGPCCFDCQSADNLQKILRTRARPELEPRTRHVLKRVLHCDILDGWSLLTFPMARVCVGNDRQEQLRLPGVPMGLAHPSVSLIRVNQGDALTDHHAWMDRNSLAPHR